MLTAVNHSKLLGVRAPSKVVDGALLIQSYAAVKVSSSTEQIHSRLSVVIHVCVVDLGLGKHENLSAQGVPLDRRTVGFVK